MGGGEVRSTYHPTPWACRKMLMLPKPDPVRGLTARVLRAQLEAFLVLLL
jgi:hypothetical protein